MIDLFLAYQSMFDHMLVYGVLAMSQYIVMRGGTFSVGTAAFAAIGGYGTAILTTKAGWPPAIAIATSSVLAMAASAVMAVPLSRLRGVFQAVATMALVQVLVTVNLNWDDLTRGALGINAIPKVATTGWLLLIVATIAAFLHTLGRSSIGRAMDVIREDETVAVSLGIQVARHQRVALIISGALGGLGGGLLACNSYAITPEDFGFNMLINALAMTVLGGRKSVWGPLVGAAVLVALPELFRVFAEYRNVFQGVLMMLVIIYLPDGIADTLLAAARERRVKRFAVKIPAAAARVSL
jgi:branched-chain amino acid transport system permease protein